MPLGNGTGPTGLGPMTGRAAGYCAGYPVLGYMNPIPGFGFGGGGAYYGGAFPAYGTMPYEMPGYSGYYPRMATPMWFGRGRFYGHFPRFGAGFRRGSGRGFIRGRGRW